MGGLALKHCVTRRYKRDEFEAITPIIKEKLLKVFDKCDMPRYYRSKESFGDADFVCCMNGNVPSNFDFKEFLLEEFESKEVFQNTSVYSFEYKELQVDMILMSEKNYDSALAYFSDNDTGNLEGRVAHKFNLKWGQDGLRYVYRIDGKQLGEIEVTRDPQKALAFLGFDVEKRNAGFDSIDEIFDYVINSKYFNPWMYDFENMNRINRERDKKRSTIQAFVKHVHPMKEAGKDAYHYFYPDKKVYLGMIDDHFPGFLRKYRELEKKEERLRAVSALYNGRLVMEHFGISGIQLGQAMGNFEKSFGSRADLEQYVLDTNDQHAIIQRFADVNFLTYK